MDRQASLANVLTDAGRCLQFAHIEQHRRLVLQRHQPRGRAAPAILFMRCADELRHRQRLRESPRLVVNPAQFAEHRRIGGAVGLPRLFEQAPRTIEDTFCRLRVAQLGGKLGFSSTAVDLQGNRWHVEQCDELPCLIQALRRSRRYS